jgi:ABC-2 type transport system ATP-binding protein
MQALSIRGLTKTYDNGFVALKGIDLDVREGEFYALLGPNGAGKSTTIGIVSSLVNKSAGQVTIFGHDLDSQREAAKRCIGLVPQEFNFNVFEPIREVIINQAGYYGIDRPEATRRAEVYLKKLDLWEKRNVSARELSGGMKRRLMIARALVHEPRLLILDEPTAGVDIEIRRSMWAFLRELNASGTTIILTTHSLEEAEALCREVAIINRGGIVEQGRVSELLSRSMVQTLVLDLKGAGEQPPVLPGYQINHFDGESIEVEVGADSAGINGLFTALSAAGIEVLSLRNKTNRLEEFFLHLVNQQSEQAA